MPFEYGRPSIVDNDHQQRAKTDYGCLISSFEGHMSDIRTSVHAWGLLNRDNSPQRRCQNRAFMIEKRFMDVYRGSSFYITIANLYKVYDHISKQRKVGEVKNTPSEIVRIKNERYLNSLAHMRTMVTAQSILYNTNVHPTGWYRRRNVRPSWRKEKKFWRRTGKKTFICLLFSRATQRPFWKSSNNLRVCGTENYGV